MVHVALKNRCGPLFLCFHFLVDEAENSALRYFSRMAKILALDIGKKRTGVAETDPYQLIATGLPTVFTTDLLTFLAVYVATEQPELLVVGEPKQMHGAPSEVEGFIQESIKKINLKFPELPIQRVDERFTSKMASHAISRSGLSKKKRENKALIDEVSAVIILQTWLGRKQ